MGRKRNTVKLADSLQPPDECLSGQCGFAGQGHTPLFPRPTRAPDCNPVRKPEWGICSRPSMSPSPPEESLVDQTQESAIKPCPCITQPDAAFVVGKIYRLLGLKGKSIILLDFNLSI